MRTTRQILGGFLKRSIMTGTASDERTALDPILAWPLAAHAGDERRVPRDRNVVSGMVGGRDEAGVESMEALVAGHGLLVTPFNITPRSRSFAAYSLLDATRLGSASQFGKIATFALPVQ
jgi:hypothetical protein